jgi:hypothetical protein
MRDNKIVRNLIGSVTIKSVGDESGKPSHELVTYGFRTYSLDGMFLNWQEINSSLVFATKEELLASL